MLKSALFTTIVICIYFITCSFAVAENTNVSLSPSSITFDVEKGVAIDSDLYIESNNLINNITVFPLGVVNSKGMNLLPQKDFVVNEIQSTKSLPSIITIPYTIYTVNLPEEKYSGSLILQYFDETVNKTYQETIPITISIKMPLFWFIVWLLIFLVLGLLLNWYKLNKYPLEKIKGGFKKFNDKLQKDDKLKVPLDNKIINPFLSEFSEIKGDNDIKIKDMINNKDIEGAKNAIKKLNSEYEKWKNSEDKWIEAFNNYYKLKENKNKVRKKIKNATIPGENLENLEGELGKILDNIYTDEWINNNLSEIANYNKLNEIINSFEDELEIFSDIIDIINIIPPDNIENFKKTEIQNWVNQLKGDKDVRSLNKVLSSVMKYYERVNPPSFCPYVSLRTKEFRAEAFYFQKSPVHVSGFIPNFGYLQDKMDKIITAFSSIGKSAEDVIKPSVFSQFYFLISLIIIIIALILGGLETLYFSNNTFGSNLILDYGKLFLLGAGLTTASQLLIESWFSQFK